MKPKYVQVGPVKWKVIWNKKKIPKHKDDTLQDLGITDVINGEIIIDDTIHEDFQKETLTHEILHAIIATQRIQIPSDGPDYDREETVVEQLAPILLDTLQRNPQIVKYLFHKE